MGTCRRCGGQRDRETWCECPRIGLPASPQPLTNDLLTVKSDPNRSEVSDADEAEARGRERGLEEAARRVRAQANDGEFHEPEDVARGIRSPPRQVMSDLDERTWWVFRLPQSTCYVPAGSEEAARAVLRKTSYQGAPVDVWPLISTRVTSREALVKSLLRKKNTSKEDTT